MKRISILILVLGLFSLLSCKKDETKTMLNSSPGAPTLTIPGGSNVTLQKADKDVALVFSWTAATYGADVIPTYFLQMDVQGHNFSNPSPMGSVTKLLTISIPTGDLNGKLVPMLDDPKVMQPLAMEFRIMTVLKDPNGATIDSVKPVYSASIPQTITPYYAPIIYPLLNVPGSYQAWNVTDSSTAIASVTMNNKYEGYAWFPDANTEFKFAKFSWDGDKNWGSNAGDGHLNPGGSNIKATDAGYYKLNADLDALTYTAIKTTWAVIGDATPGGWNTDTPMTYDPATKVWSVTVDLTAGGLKFRANGVWDLNYGDTGAKGSLVAGGDNIVSPGSGNYTITMNLSNPVYKYKFVKN